MDQKSKEIVSIFDQVSVSDQKMEKLKKIKAKCLSIASYLLPIGFVIFLLAAFETSHALNRGESQEYKDMVSIIFLGTLGVCLFIGILHKILAFFINRKLGAEIEKQECYLNHYPEEEVLQGKRDELIYKKYELVSDSF